MAFFDFLQSKSDKFEDLLKRIDATCTYYWLDEGTQREINGWPNEKKLQLIRHIINTHNDVTDTSGTWTARQKTYYNIIHFFTQSKIDFETSAHQTITLLAEKIQQIDTPSDTNSFLNQIVIPIVENFVNHSTDDSTPAVQALTAISTAFKKMMDTDYYSKTIISLIDKLDGYIARMQGVTVRPMYFFGKDPFAKLANECINQQSEHERILWFQLMAIARTAKGSKPTKKYLNECRSVTDRIGATDFTRIITKWFDFIGQLKDIVRIHHYAHNGEVRTQEIIEFIDDLNFEAIKGFVWMSLLYYDDDCANSVARLAIRCYKKIPGVGAPAVSVGNACLYVLHASNSMSGVTQLTQLKQKVKHQSAIRLIEQYIGEYSFRSGIDKSELEDLAVNDFSISNGCAKFAFDDYNAVLELTDIGTSKILWHKQDGTIQKSIPSSVSDNQSDALLHLKSVQKQVNQALTAQKDRMDKMLRSNRKMKVAYFNQRYLDNGLIEFVMRNLIFNFYKEDVCTSAIYINQEWIDVNYGKVYLNEYDEVSLWHPVMSSADEVMAWRKLIADSELKQPFKQAYREIYLITDAEINTHTYSNRMASHILKQHQFVALAKARNWKTNLLGTWDGGDTTTATLELEEYSLRAEYWVSAVEADGQYTEAGFWNYVSTDQVRFVHTQTFDVISVLNIPPVVFSEVMRDVDLFVGVASVGNDPNWRDSGGVPAYTNYWESYSFGDLSETAKNRKEALQYLIPKLKISSQVNVGERFVTVKGKLRTYKIHIGSGNILMEPNDEYLCIVPDRNQKNPAEKTFLPFESDGTLSVILSKAFLLADDDKIKDPTILSQIKRHIV